MFRLKFATPVIVALLFLAIPIAVLPQTPKPIASLLYTEYCTPCHGSTGAGDGELAYLLFPKPRDFTSGRFKLRTTPSGSQPTKNDLTNVIRNGMPGTPMPSFAFLTDDQINALVSQVGELAQFSADDPEVIPLPTPLPSSPRLIALGRQAYGDMGCAQCHGSSGKGDGPSAAALRDEWGYPISVRDFTTGDYIGGGRPEDLYFRFVGGMDGTPMPSYLDMLADLADSEQRRQQILWGLIYYTKSLEIESPAVADHLDPSDGVIVVPAVANSLTADDLNKVDGPHWQSAEVYAIALNRLWQQSAANTASVEVSAVHTKKYLALKLTWSDVTENTDTYRIQDFQDGAAVQFSIDGTAGFHGMGSAEHPTDIWHWKADWQSRFAAGQSPDIDLAYTARASDAAVATYPAVIGEQAFLAGVAAGNVLSGPDLSSPIEETGATGPQTLVSKSGKRHNVSGGGQWDGKQWSVVFVRKLNIRKKKSVKFKKRGTYPVAFAIWNGNVGDRNGQKSVSTWYKLELK
ncbi:MAG: c-type cytochrome [Candidatus Marinimicrobia bacterium]|nr:c-type cytochrome [Candidatus Neomarinimicrobiota bacterium]